MISNRYLEIMKSLMRFTGARSFEELQTVLLTLSGVAPEE